MKLVEIMFIALALALAAGIGAVTLRPTPAAANYGNACVYKPEPVECPCATCSWGDSSARANNGGGACREVGSCRDRVGWKIRRMQDRLGGATALNLLRPLPG